MYCMGRTVLCEIHVYADCMQSLIPRKMWSFVIFPVISIPDKFASCLMLLHIHSDSELLVPAVLSRKIYPPFHQSENCIHIFPYLILQSKKPYLSDPFSSGISNLYFDSYFLFYTAKFTSSLSEPALQN